MRLTIALFFFLLTTTYYSVAQTNTQVHWEPSVSYTFKLQNRWSFNTNTLFRNNLVQYNGEGAEQEYRWTLNETQFFATYSLLNTMKLSGGYAFQSRLREDTFFDEHRLMEQFAFVFYALQGKRIANRVRLEQRIRQSGYVNRLRYRLGFDSPLNGEQLDPGEIYAIVTNEVLWSFSNIRQGLENRLFAGIGWFFNKQYKLQTGLMYRVSKSGNSYDNVLALSTTFYINRRERQKKPSE